MPPHCDSLDGPVVLAAVRALDAGDVDLVLPYVTADGEDEVRTAFDRAVRARTTPEAREVADLYFFDTVVRVHRAGEGAPYTGLKPAGLDVGPVIPAAEKAIESGSPDEVLGVLTDALGDEVRRRLDDVVAHRPSTGAPVAEVREYVGAMLGFQVWAHSVYRAISAPAHAHGGGGRTQGGGHRH